MVNGQEPQQFVDLIASNAYADNLGQKFDNCNDLMNNHKMMIGTPSDCIKTLENEPKHDDGFQKQL